MLLDYQKNVYNEMCNVLANNNCCCVIMGTGVGKTYVAQEYLEEHNYKALVVSPRNFINDNWLRLCGNKVETITYQKLCRIYSTIDFTNYDVLILDEVHHVGAVKWGKPIKDLLSRNIIKIIGLTESSVRYTDGARDVAQEYFNNNVAFGYDVSSAIEQGILNPVTYVGAIYNSDGLKKTLRGKIQSRLYAKLNLVLNQTPTVQEILKKNMPEGKRKGIIFASTIDDIKFAMDFMHSVYPSVDIRFVHSKQSNMFNDSTLEWFTKTDEGYICSVDMMSEGVHIKGINTLIMLRRTESPSIFNQQLGRCLDANSKEPAVVFDLVNNKNTIRIIKNSLSIRTNSLFDSKVLNIRPSQQLIIKDYTKDIIDVLKEIKSSLDNLYTTEELEKLKSFYKDNPSGYGLKEWVKNNLPNHSYISVCSKSQGLGLRNGNLLWFSNDDVEFIKKYYSEKGSAWVAEKLNRTPNSIKAKASKLGLRYVHSWTEDEINIVKKYYAVEGRKVLKRLPGVTETNLRSWVARNPITFSGRSVMCIETGVVYKSACFAQETLTGKPSKKQSKILKCCEGKLDTAFGYHWKYIDKKGGE